MTAFKCPFCGIDPEPNMWHALDCPERPKQTQAERDAILQRHAEIKEYRYPFKHTEDDNAE